MTVLNLIGKRIIHRGAVLDMLHRTFIHTVAVAAIRIQRQRAITARQRLARATTRHHTQRLATLARAQSDLTADRTSSILRRRHTRLRRKPCRVIVRRHRHRQRLIQRIAMTVLNLIGKRIIHRGAVLDMLHRTFIHTVAVAAIRIQRQRAIVASSCTSC
ncbi:hypothetical protein FV185_09480 [Ferrovum sp. PN-J185]|nr:hypothetical protein FV185_09480 [Ferrovum sp. PN-J185]